MIFHCVKCGASFTPEDSVGAALYESAPTTLLIPNKCPSCVSASVHKVLLRRST